jgi:opacity protein-like surface antigen
MKKRLAALGISAVLLTAGRAEAQRVAPQAFNPRLAAKASNSSPAPQGRRQRSNPTVTLQGGVATGDGSFDFGILVGASFGWDINGLPIDIRFDPSLARYGAGNDYADGSLLIFGIPGAVEYEFTTQGNTKPYIMGGLGLYYSRFSVDVNVPGGGDVGGSNSETDFGITVGGGLRFNSKFGIEVRITDLDGFTTIPILFTLRM